MERLTDESRQSQSISGGFPYTFVATLKTDSSAALRNGKGKGSADSTSNWISFGAFLIGL
jgi:hypothetical protein